MEAKELMIGDLVRVSKDVSIKKGTIVEIRAIDADREFHELKGCATCVPVDNHDGLSGGVWCDYLEPIQLTSEKLEQNGFYYERNIGYVYEDCEYEVIVDLWNNSYRILHNRDVMMNIQCFSNVFVHDLQHALRHCNVDKDIIIKED